MLYIETTEELVSKIEWLSKYRLKGFMQSFVAYERRLIELRQVMDLLDL